MKVRVLRKIDIGLIGVRLEEEEYKQIDAMWMELKKMHPEWIYIEKPNVVIDVYKNRRGEMNYVKVFRYFDYGTCHTVDLFITDTSYKMIEGMGELRYEINKYSFLDLKVGGAF